MAKIKKKRKRKELKTRIRKQKQLVNLIYSHIPCKQCLVLATCRIRYRKHVEDYRQKIQLDPGCEVLTNYLNYFRANKITQEEAETMIYCVLTDSNKAILHNAVANSQRHLWESWFETSKPNLRRR